MQPLSCIAFTLLCSLSFLSSGLSMQCNKTQYPWPVDAPKLCCNMCPPGKLMVRRPDSSCSIECASCTGDRYADSYNVDMSCTICRSCKKQNMVYKSNCTATDNAVCECEAGYRCRDPPCSQCVLIPNIPASTTLSPSTSTSTPTILTTPWASFETITDMTWFHVIIVLLCIVLILAVAAKIRPFLCWIRSKLYYVLNVKPVLVPQCTEFEEVSKPVQEVCGKCDQLIDV